MLIAQSFSCCSPFGVNEAEFVRTTFIYSLDRRFTILIAMSWVLPSRLIAADLFSEWMSAWSYQCKYDSWFFHHLSRNGEENHLLLFAVFLWSLLASSSVKSPSIFDTVTGLDSVVFISMLAQINALYPDLPIPPCQGSHLKYLPGLGKRLVERLSFWISLHLVIQSLKRLSFWIWNYIFVEFQILSLWLARCWLISTRLYRGGD